MTDNKYIEKKWYIYLKTKYGLSDDDMEEYIESFNIYNKGDIITGSILSNYYNEEIKKDHMSVDNATEIIVNINKKTNNKEISYLNMKTYLSYIIPECQQFVVHKIGIKEFFDSIDVNQDGKITCAELTNVLYKVNKNFTPKEIEIYKTKIKEMCKTADVNEDGFISFDEFKEFMTTLLEKNAK